MPTTFVVRENQVARKWDKRLALQHCFGYFTMMLSPGAVGTLSEIRGAWLQHNNSSGFSVHVSMNHVKPKARFLSVCCSTPRVGWNKATGCRAHVRAVGNTRESMTITSVDLVHTCGNGPKRKRNYLTRDISEVSPVLELYQPTTSKAGNAQQFASMAKTATGVSVKNGQASLAIRAKSNNTIEAQIGQYMFIPSLFRAYTEDDPAGTFCYETFLCHWDRTLKQFHRCYIALSFAKTFWKHARIPIVICDGTHTRGGIAFKHIILIACTFDGNNQVTILAFAIVPVEDADNWTWFKVKLDADFPGYTIWISDADKGIRSQQFSLSLSQTTEDDVVVSRCTRHLSDNCRENCKSGPMNNDHQLMILNLAKARTHELYNVRLEAIRDINEPWADYLDRRSDEFCTFSFLQRGHKRYGKVTSNGVENINGAIVDERSYPIVLMIQGIVKYQQGKFATRKNLGRQWQQENKRLTHYARSEDIRIGTEAQTRTVQMLESEPDVLHKARVSVTDPSSVTAYVLVTVDIANKTIGCPCKYYEEMGMPCVHAKAVLLHVGTQPWFDERYHVETYNNCYSGPIPGFATAGRLRLDERMVPPEHKRMAGRPKKKRRDRSHLRTTNKQHGCKACGKSGHHASTCDNPSTQYRCVEHKEKAIQWCRKQEAIGLE